MKFSIDAERERVFTVFLKMPSIFSVVGLFFILLQCKMIEGLVPINVREKNEGLKLTPTDDTVSKLLLKTKSNGNLTGIQSGRYTNGKL